MILIVQVSHTSKYSDYDNQTHTQQQTQLVSLVWSILHNIVHIFCTIHVCLYMILYTCIYVYLMYHNHTMCALCISTSLGWRPAFKLYSKWVSLLGSGLCLAVMFVIKWWAALITLVSVLALYLIVYWRKPGMGYVIVSTGV